MCPFPSCLLHQSIHRCFGWCSFDLGRSCKMYSHLSRILCKSIKSKMVSWTTRRLIRNSVVTSETCFQPTSESPDVFTCNRVVRLLRVCGAETVHVFIDIRVHQGRVL